MAEHDHPAFDNFVETVAKLRSPDGGCPWNRAQTHASIGDYMIEEAYEALDAIQAGDAEHLREELGDVLLQVVLHSQIAADAGEFTIDDVCADINEKMVRRHPHVFGDVRAENANEVADLWEQVKLAEKEAKAARAAERARVATEEGAGAGPMGVAGGDAAGGSAADAVSDGSDSLPSLLDDVPTPFPALLQAQKISRRAVAAGFEWEALADVWEKVAEERAELEEAYAAAPKTPDGKVLKSADGEVAAAEASAPVSISSNAASTPGSTSAGTIAPAGTDAHTGTIAPAGAVPAGAARASTAGSPATTLAPTNPDALVNAVEMEFGDLLFALVNVARKMGIDAESALRASNAKFRRRWAAMERAARDRATSVEELSTDEMERLWQQAKEEE